MNVEVRIQGTDLAEVVRRYAVRRLRFALGRFASRVGKVTVRITDVNGTRGGVDQCCHVSMERLPSGKLVVEQTDADLLSAIDRAVERVERTFKRDLQRARQTQTSHESVRIQL